MKIKVSNANTPNWKEVTVKSHIPEELKKLEEMARNIWWAWNYEATDLFRDLDPATWKEVGQNPVALLERLSYEKLEALTQDKVIVKRMNDVYAKFKAYVDAKPDSKRPSVAYFCMEYGLTHVLKIYSGGLGILAGDYLKEASDSNVDMCGVGFLYRYGYFSQSLSMDGQQIANYESQNFGSLPIERVMDENGQPMVVDVPYLNYFVHAYVWKVNVGRRSAGAPLGVHSRRSRHPAQETLPVCSGRRGYGSGLSAGKMASRTRGESGCHHRCQDQVDADLYRGDGPCSGQSLHRYRRRQRRLQRYGNGPDQRPDRQPGQAVRRLRGHRSDDYDEVRDAHDQGVLPADGRIAQYADGRWYGHVRRLPRHGGRQDRLHLCRWPRIRRVPGRFRRSDAPSGYVPHAGRACPRHRAGARERSQMPCRARQITTDPHTTGRFRQTSMERCSASECRRRPQNNESKQLWQIKFRAFPCANKIRKSGPPTSRRCATVIMSRKPRSKRPAA